MAKLKQCSSTFGRLKSSALVTLPNSTADPAEIDWTADAVVQVSFQCSSDSRFCKAESATDAATKIGNDACDKASANVRYGIPCVGEDSEKLYIRSAGTSDVAKGIAYSLIEGDRA